MRGVVPNVGVAGDEAATQGPDSPALLAQKRERPSTHGAILGDALAELANASPIPAEMCATCAFRRGSYPNQSAATGLVALKCATRVDHDAFVCHHGMKGGEPSRMCDGFLAVLLVPDAERQRIVEAMVAKVNAHDGAAPDAVRAACDAWLATVDPEGDLNDHVRARLWAKRPPADGALGASRTDQSNTPGLNESKPKASAK